MAEVIKKNILRKFKKIKYDSNGNKNGVIKIKAKNGSKLDINNPGYIPNDGTFLKTEKNHYEKNNGNTLKRDRKMSLVKNGKSDIANIYIHNKGAKNKRTGSITDSNIYSTNNTYKNALIKQIKMKTGIIRANGGPISRKEKDTKNANIKKIVNKDARPRQIKKQKIVTSNKKSGLMAETIKYGNGTKAGRSVHSPLMTNNASYRQAKKDQRKIKAGLTFKNGGPTGKKLNYKAGSQYEAIVNKASTDARIMDKMLPNTKKAKFNKKVDDAIKKKAVEENSRIAIETKGKSLNWNNETKDKNDVMYKRKLACGGKVSHKKSCGGKIKKKC